MERKTMTISSKRFILTIISKIAFCMPKPPTLLFNLTLSALEKSYSHTSGLRQV